MNRGLLVVVIVLAVVGSLILGGMLLAFTLDSIIGNGPKNLVTPQEVHDALGGNWTRYSWGTGSGGFDLENVSVNSFSNEQLNSSGNLTVVTVGLYDFSTLESQNEFVRASWQWNNGTNLSFQHFHNASYLFIQVNFSSTVIGGDRLLAIYGLYVIEIYTYLTYYPLSEMLGLLDTQLSLVT